MTSEGGDGKFTVTVTNKEVVAAEPPLQEHRLPLSNLDLLLPPVDVSVFFCYKGDNHMNFGSMVSVLKRAMAQVLRRYYAFAGEVVANFVGEPEILCNNRGVDLSEGFADIDLKNLNLYNPDKSVEGKLVPKKKDGVLAVQAMKLKCGSVVVACTFDHRVADFYSANMFLVSWAKMAQSGEFFLLPSFKRSVLNPRRPACIDPSLANMYVPISKLNLEKPQLDFHHLISRIYYVKADQLDKLQSLASSNGCKRTKLESFSAFLWQLIAKSAKENDSTEMVKISKMGIVVDGRTRLTDKAKMAAYFGNVLSIPYGSKRVDELIENPLSWIADEVHDFLKSAVTKEHFLGLIDFVEVHRPEPVLAKMYSSGSDDGPAFVVSSGQRFPVSGIDFGWGSPAFGSYHFPWGGNAGYVMPMPSPVRNGDWIVYMHLLKEQMELIETEATDFFKPLTWDYLNLLSTD